MPILSVIVPCHNECEALPLFYDELCLVAGRMKGILLDLCLVDDGSTDGTIQVMRALARRDPRVRYLSFSRNFGKEAAMYAGFQAATGDYVAVMDADLQDPPRLLPEMLDGILREGYDCVATRRATRAGEPPIRSFFARAFYRMINRISHISIVDGARDFRLMTRRMVNAILEVGEYNRFSKGIFQWVGFKVKWLSYDNVQRVAGKTKWSFWKLFLYSLDGILAYSTAPLAFASMMGVLFCLIAFILIIYIVVKTLIYGDPVAGWPSQACLILTIGGIQLFCVGILGHYLSKTYLETKKRPIYIVRESSEDAAPGERADVADVEERRELRPRTSA